MKHYKSVEFSSNFRMQGPLNKRKAPLLKLYGDGSGVQVEQSTCSASERLQLTHRELVITVCLIYCK